MEPMLDLSSKLQSKKQCLSNLKNSWHLRDGLSDYFNCHFCLSIRGLVSVLPKTAPIIFCNLSNQLQLKKQCLLGWKNNLETLESIFVKGLKKGCLGLTKASLFKLGSHSNSLQFVCFCPCEKNSKCWEIFWLLLLLFLPSIILWLTYFHWWSALIV